MEYTNGPDQIIPCENMATSQIHGCAKLRSTGHESETEVEFCSLPGMLRRVAEKYPDHPALVTVQQDGSLKKYSYSEYEHTVRICAKAFLKLGLERFRSVCILGFNSPEWFISEFAAIYAGGVATGIYSTNSSDACFTILENSKANIVVVEDDVQLQKILSKWSRLPHLKAIIQYSGEPTSDDVLSWDQLVSLGKQQPDEELERVLKTIAINQCCIVVYTSGTTDKPKGVMVSHDNILYNAKGIARQINLQTQCETIVSYLPLSHIAGQTVDIYMTLISASTVFFADKNALKGSLINTLQLARPTRFLGVPRVWEKIRESITQVGAQNNFIKKQLAAWARAQGLQHNLNRLHGVNTNSWGYGLANALVFKKIKQALGFDRCITFTTAAAPLSLHVKKFFLSINIPIVESFGMSELAGAHTMGNDQTFDLYSVACTIPGVETKVISENGQSTGELCMYGRHVFMGYLNQPEKTLEVIDQEGWLHSGDLGYVDEKNKLYVTGRLKEILITAGGENVAPVPIEERVRQEIPYVSQSFLVGDKRKFLSVLLTLKTEVDPATSTPTDILTKDVEKWLKSLGSEATTVPEVLEEGPLQQVLNNIQKAIDIVNARAISNAQKIQKFTILPRDFSIAGGELGSTMKVRRNEVLNKYNTVINALYTS